MTTSTSLPGRAFARRAAFGRTEDLEVRGLRGDERQRAVVEQQTWTTIVPTGSGGPPIEARADLALRVEHLALFGPEGRRLAEHVPLARRVGLRRRSGARVLRKVQREAADERALAIVELDRGRQPRARERGLAPDEERALRSRRRRLRAPAVGRRRRPTSTGQHRAARRFPGAPRSAVPAASAECFCASTAYRVAMSERIAVSAK